MPLPYRGERVVIKSVIVASNNSQVFRATICCNDQLNEYAPCCAICPHAGMKLRPDMRNTGRVLQAVAMQLLINELSFRQRKGGSVLRAGGRVFRATSSQSENEEQTLTASEEQPLDRTLS